MPMAIILALLVLIVLGAWIYLQFYRKHMLGENAPEQTVSVTILDKQTIDVPDAPAGQDDLEYWIYVQRGHFGPKREFQVGVHYYHSLNPGDKGLLTYQGNTFLHFAMQRQATPSQHNMP